MSYNGLAIVKLIERLQVSWKLKITLHAVTTAGKMRWGNRAAPRRPSHVLHIHATNSGEEPRRLVNLRTELSYERQIDLNLHLSRRVDIVERCSYMRAAHIPLHVCVLY